MEGDSEVLGWEVRSIEAKNQKKFREVTYQFGKYQCNCESYCKFGLICRHIFTLKMVKSLF